MVAHLVTEHTSPWLILVAHVVISRSGLAFMFTPLFTSALGSVEPQLYSHGSAMVGTVQQVAGAAGTALFITVMTARTATATAGGCHGTGCRGRGHPRGVPRRSDPLALGHRRRVLRAPASRHDAGRARGALIRHTASARHPCEMSD